MDDGERFTQDSPLDLRITTGTPITFLDQPQLFPLDLSLPKAVQPPAPSTTPQDCDRAEELPVCQEGGGELQEDMQVDEKYAIQSSTPSTSSLDSDRLEESPASQEGEEDMQVDEEDAIQSSTASTSSLDSERVEESPVNQEGGGEEEVQTDEADQGESEEVEEVREAIGCRFSTHLFDLSFSLFKRAGLITNMADSSNAVSDNKEANSESGKLIGANYVKDSLALPVTSDRNTLAPNLLSLDHSFGFDCRGLYNLTVVDGNVLIYVTGSYLHVYHTKTGELVCHRSYGPGCISKVTKNPFKPHLAIAERGENPLILICSWPSFKISHSLENGAQKGYSYLEYSPEGKLLLSQSSAPDFLVTIWVWEKSEVFFRCKAYERDVYCVHFSGFYDHQLVSSGASHIKFWNMNDTFTGQKLQGELGRFGKTETCDLLSALPLPDGTFASGSAWGNILIWDEGAIKFEVFRTGGLHCHTAQITQLVFSNSALLTAGLDGAVRLWNYESIEMADPPEDTPFIEMEPLFELFVKVGDVTAQLLNIAKATPAPFDSTWYAQDLAGAVWKLDITTNVDAKGPKIEFICHSGPVVSVQASPAEDLFASLGADGQLFVYKFMTKEIETYKEFSYAGTCLQWLPPSVSPSGKALIGGFDDGVIRLIFITSSGFQVPAVVRSIVKTKAAIRVAQAVKPHMLAVTSLALSVTPEDNLMASGSEDGTVFFFRVISTPILRMESVGICPTGSPVTCLIWGSVSSRQLLVGCVDGKVLLYSIPPSLAPDSGDTNVISLEPRVLSVEMVLRDFIKLGKSANEKLEKVEERKEDEELQYDEASKVEDETDENLSLISGPVLFLWNSPYDTLWFSLGGVKPGTVFEYSFHESRLIRGLDIMPMYAGEVHCCLYSAKNDCLFLGYSNGRIAAVRPKQANDHFWHYQVHKNYGDTVREMCFNFDESYLFSCGDDGTLFSFRLPPEFSSKRPRPELVPLHYVQISPDIDGKLANTVEEMQIKRNYEEKVRLGEEHKQRVTKELAILEEQYMKVLEANAKLPEPLRLSDGELVPDARVVEDMNRLLDEEDEESCKKLLRETERSQLLLQKLRNYLIDDLETLTIRVDCIDSEGYVETFRLAKLGEDFEQNLLMVKQRMFDMEAKGREQSVVMSIGPQMEKISEAMNPIEALLKQVSVLGDIDRNFQLCRLYDKYCKRRAAAIARFQTWQDFLARKPNPDQQDPADVIALERARETLGDLTLKTSPEYKVPKHMKVSTVSKTLSLMEARQKMYDFKYSFNCKVLDFRRRKQEMIKKHLQLRDVLIIIGSTIPDYLILNPPALPTIDEDAEFPEKKLTFFEQDVIKEKSEKMTTQLKLSRRRSRRKTFAKIELGLKKKFEGDPYKFEIAQFQELGKRGNQESAWESELKDFESLQTSLRKQSEIIDEMTQEINTFDRDVRLLRDMKIKIDADAKFFEIYILALSREVHVLKDFEGEERKKSESALSHLKEKEDLQKGMNETLLKIDLRLKEIHNGEDEMRVLVSKYLSSIADNKYFDFLKRIFKRKYKAPKPVDADSDESSSSEDESESDEGDDKSLDSKDINIFDMDENVCPEGCDRALYDLTFASRAQRHNLESSIADKKKEVDALKKFFEGSTKQMLVCDKLYLSAQQDLETFQRDKQVKLNEIETLIILTLSQFQNFQEVDTFEKIEQSVVMGAPLLAKLHNRGSDLEKETKQQKEKHSQNRQHLQRMAIDIRYMTQVIKEKEKEIEEVMMRKFGSIVDLNELEESLLKKLVAEMGFIAFEFEKELTKGLRPLHERLSRRQETYASRLKQNTERFNIIALLNEEKTRIERVLEKQELKMKVPEKEEDFREIEKLEKTIRKQEDKLIWMREEIHAIKFKHTRAREAKALEEELSEPVIPMASIKAADGKYHMVSEMLKLELKSLVEDIEELMIDIEGGFVTKEGANRLKNLIEEFADKLPTLSLKTMLKKLDEEKIVEDDCQDSDDAIVNNLDALLSKAKLALEMAPDFDASDAPDAVGSIKGDENETSCDEN